jgi:ATP-binding cassette subfamily C protein
MQHVVVTLRENAMDTALNLPLETTESSESSDVISRVTRDVDAVTEASSGVLPAFTSAVFTIALSMTGIALLDYRLALAALAAVPLQVVGTTTFLRASRGIYRHARFVEADRGQAIIESVTGAITIQEYGIVSERLTEVNEKSLYAIEVQRKAARLRNRFYAWLNAAEFVGLAAILTVSFLLVGNNTVTIGAATAAALYFFRLFGPIGQFLSSLDDVQRAGVGFARLVGLAQAQPHEPTTQPDSGTAQQEALGTDIRVTGVSHTYPGREPALKDVTITVPAGQRVAFVGASGCGKSTLGKIIAGLIAPTSGTVHTSELPVLVSQEVHVFADTLAQNLRLGAPGKTDRELTAELIAVGAHWVEDLPDGLHTVLGAGGHQLSSAQAQMLALARVRLIDPKIVVFDEVTAETDHAGGTGLETILNQLCQERTSIVIAHRLSQAAASDRIIMFADGNIVEDGTHEQLVDAGQHYARLWSAWERKTHFRDSLGSMR